MAPKHTPKKRLRKLGFDEVSLVPSGDDPMAEVVLSKADPDHKTNDGSSSPSTVNPSTTKGVPAVADGEISKDDLPDEVRQYIDTLEDMLGEAIEDGFQPEGVEADDIIDVDDADDDDIDDDVDTIPVVTADLDTDEDVEDDVNDPELALAKADPHIRALIAKAEQRAEQAEAIAKYERDQRLTREFVAKAAALPMISTNKDDLGGLLKALTEKAPEEAARVEELLRSANDALSKSDIFSEFGKAGEMPLGGEVEARVEALVKADPNMTREQALVRVYESDPKLYEMEG